MEQFFENFNLEESIKNFHITVSMEEVDGFVVPVFNCSEPIAVTLDAYSAMIETLTTVGATIAEAGGTLSIENFEGIVNQIVKSLILQDEIFFRREESDVVYEVSEFQNLVMIDEDGDVFEFYPDARN